MHVVIDSPPDVGAAAVGATGLWKFSSPLGGVRTALAGMAPAERRGLRIADIEQHVILALYRDYNALALIRMSLSSATFFMYTLYAFHVS